MRITPYNQITSDLTITASSRVLEYPTDNLFDTYGTQVVKFTGKTDEWLVFEKPTFFDFNSIGIVNHNFTAAATITIEAHTSDSWGSPAYTQTLTWKEYLIYEFITAVDTADNYDFVRLRVQDAANTANVCFGIVILGDYIQLPGFSFDVAFTDTNYGVSNTSESGQTDGSSKYTGRQFPVNMGAFSNTQRLAIRTLIETNGDYQPFMAVLWESDFDKEPPLYCVTSPSFTATQLDNQLNEYAGTFLVQERF
jgi:hypothetical protein